MNLNILISFSPHSLCAFDPCALVLTPLSDLTPTPVPLDHITPLAILTRMTNRAISWEGAKLSCADQGDEKRLDGEQKNLHWPQQHRGCGEAACRTLVHGYN